MAYNPGSFGAGCPVFTINSVTYKVNQLNYPQTSDAVQNINDELGDYTNMFANKGAITGSATLQCAASTTVFPTTAAQNSTTGLFSANIGSNSAAQNLAITSVSVPRPSQGVWTFEISFQKVA
jgi:hypothetical protein